MTIWKPFSLGRRIDDTTTLGATPLFAGLSTHEVETLADLLELGAAEAGDVIVSAGDAALGPVVVVAGEAAAKRTDGSMLSFKRASHWGEAALDVETIEPWTIRAVTPARLVRLTRARFRQLGRTQPTLALELLRRATVVMVLGDKGDAPPLGGRVRIGETLPASIEGALVVAARVENRTHSLSDSLAPGATAVPITIGEWEGREVYRRTAGLVFLAAAERLGLSKLTLGPSWTSGRRIIGVDPDEDPMMLAKKLTAEIDTLVREAAPIREENWDVDDARRHFEGRGWFDAASRLESEVRGHLQLVACGEVRVPSPGAILPSASWLSDVQVLWHPDGLCLDFGQRVRAHLVKRPRATMLLEAEAPRYSSGMTNEERLWLERLGIVSVGAFNRACVTGEVRTLIDVAEGFHEKRLASLADQIRSRGSARIVAVAGPSSSGKTTFLKRLTTQLRVDGIDPIGISLDDYYVDRARTVRDAQGEYDFEALEAIDVDLLSRHLKALLDGARVKTAHYDFVTGKSDHEGGPELELLPSSVLVVEGIHALNPALYDEETSKRVFRIFIHPATSLPFDPLTTLEPTDVRLLRRIVRDRHSRGWTAEQNLARWPSVRRGERLHVDPWRTHADFVFDTSLIYEVSVLKVFAERYLLEVPRSSAQYSSATSLRRMLQPFVPIYPERVPPTSILREFIGSSAFSY